MSVWVLVQLPPQNVSVVPQVQTPLLQNSPPVQTLLQELVLRGPQLLLSERVLVQALPH